ncbi:MAG TPA: type II secretion system F family protein [Phycisphaerales bacterium]|nr:type II secretion system F family protein [Phycisphaerales bacterium]
MSVTTYHYEAIDAQGAQIKGSIRAMDEAEAYRKLAASALTPLVLSAVKERASGMSFNRVNLTDIVNLTRELAVLVEAKIPLDRGLISIAEQERKPELAAMIRDIATMIEGGQTITSAMDKYRATFGDVYIETMSAAEKSGNMQAVTTHLAEMLEKQLEARSQLRRALAYPVIVLCMVGVALAVIVGFVVPKFAATFAQGGKQLPLATKIVQAVGASFNAYWWAYLLGLAGTLIALTITWRNPKGRLVLEALLLKLPYVGKVITSMAAARFSRVLAIALSSGLDVIEAINIAGRSTGRPIFVNDCVNMTDSLRQGERLVDVLQRTRYLPPFAKRMIGAGKDAKELSRSCEIVSRHFDREASNLAKNVNTIVEPIMTVALAAIVLVVALSVFLPMWQMARVMK